MHMGALATIGTANQKNFFHIVLNNNAHDSVGGQPTCGISTSIENVALACGYKKVFVANTVKEFQNSLNEISKAPGPTLINVKICKGARSDLIRPHTSPLENKESFMKKLLDI